MTLTVLSVAYPYAPVGEGAVGGAEQVLAHLDAALVRAGHRSLVVACEGSETAGTLIPTPAVRGEIDIGARGRAFSAHRDAIERALARWDVDVIHFHGLDFASYLPEPGVSTLVSLHLPPSWYPPKVFSSGRPRTWLQPVSASQRRDCPPSASLLPEIENGVPVEALSARHAKRGYTLALGRICPEKGFHIALDAVRAADVPLLIAGEVFPYGAHEAYFRDEIQPRLDARRRYLGPVGFARKRRLLSAARCLLLPSLAPETSSLVAMEALACGTPVIAFPAGALPEIVEHGRTGFLVDGAEDMAAAIPKAASLDPHICRSVAMSRFSAERMAAQYLSLYRDLASLGRERADVMDVETALEAEHHAA